MEINRYKIVLVVPPLANAGVALTSLAGAEHIGLGYIASSLRQKGYSVEILNFDIPIYVAVQTGKDNSEIVLPLLQDCAKKIMFYKPNFVGFTITGPTLNIALKIAGYIRKENLNIHICLGGHQASATGKKLLEEENIIDSIALGESDHTIIDLINRLEKGVELKGIEGFFYRNNNKILGGWHISSSKNVYELDSVAFPARDDLEIIYTQTNLREARLSSSRGCNGFCTFCADATQHKFRRYKMRSPENVVKELEFLKNTYQIEHFWLVDDNFLLPETISQERAKLIAKLIIERNLNITVRAYFRPDAFKGAPDLMDLLFKAGFITGLIGIESGSPRRLKYLGKRCSLQDIRKSVLSFHRVGMGLQIGFIFFDPLTTFEDMKIDADFLYEIKELYVLFNFVQNMDVYPGTAYRKMLENKGLSTAIHPYKGDFRQYSYIDKRIEQLAKGLEEFYTDELMAIDHAIWRLKIFTLPKLKWLTLRGKTDQHIEKIKKIQFETKKNCDILNKIHYDFLKDLIVSVEGNSPIEILELNFNKLLYSRASCIENLMYLHTESSQLLKNIIVS